MTDMMTFPETWEEFEKSYGFVDGEEVYTNGSRLIPSFRVKQWLDHIAHLESKQQATVSSDCISRQAAIDATWFEPSYTDPLNVLTEVRDRLKALPSAQPEQRYTEEELSVFAHGISLSLLSKRSAQHWRYDKDTATEIEFLERLYEKVGADMRGEQDE